MLVLNVKISFTFMASTSTFRLSSCFLFLNHSAIFNGLQNPTQQDPSIQKVSSPHFLSFQNKVCSLLVNFYHFTTKLKNVQ